MWPFKREQPARPHKVSPETAELQQRTAELARRIDAQGIETRATAREAEIIRQTNHFAVSLIAAMNGPGRKEKLS